MMKLRSLTISRTHSGPWLVGGLHHCGHSKDLIRDKRNRPAIVIATTVTVRCAPALDQRGFLFDQAMLNVWLDAISTSEVWNLSCERLVIAVGERLLSKLARDVPHCDALGLRLTMSPAPHGASMTATWGAPDA